MTLSNRQFSALVENGRYPDDVEVPLDPPFVNDNGEIQNLLLEKFTSAAIIHSVEGSIRANHYHKTDWHYAYVVSGEIWYFWRPLGSTAIPNRRTFPAGTMFFTPPLVEHAMFFPIETTFITFARNIRDTEHHEADLIRVALIEAARNHAHENWEFRYPTSAA